MRKVFCAVALVWSLCAFGQSPVVDSLVSDFTTYTGGRELEISAGFLVYVSNAHSSDSLQIKLGSSSGGSDIYEATFALSSLQTGSHNGTYYRVDAGHYPIVPPFVQLVLISGSQPLPPFNIQLVD